ncbi:hypothetical protein ACQPZJ_15295 [Actinoplanes sp. CA-054009]
MALSVVYTPETGHVLGAVTSIGAPETADPATLAGAALPLRVSLGAAEPAVVSVPARELAAHVPDDEPAVLTDPLAFSVEKPGTGLVRLRTWTEGLSFTPAGLSVKLPTTDNVNATHVVAFVTEGPETRTTSGDIKAGDDTVELPIAVANGPHAVLVLATGWAGRLEAVTKQ